MTRLTFSETLSRVEDALFDLHHGTLEEITRRANCGSPAYIEKFLKVLLLFDKADTYIKDSALIYRIEEHEYDPDPEEEAEE